MIYQVIVQVEADSAPDAIRWMRDEVLINDKGRVDSIRQFIPITSRRGSWTEWMDV